MLKIKTTFLKNGNGSKMAMVTYGETFSECVKSAEGKKFFSKLSSEELATVEHIGLGGLKPITIHDAMSGHASTVGAML